MNKNYDFAGWVTKNDIKCSDGLIIKHNAFFDNDNTKVPLVWEHNHKGPENVLGYITLHNKAEGVYGYGYFNSSQQGLRAKELVQHGDIVSMSIAANRVKRQNGNDVIHGNIYEVSLVLAGANPGAVIESVITHSDSDEESVIIYTDEILHSSTYPEDLEEDDNEEFEHDDSVSLSSAIADALTDDELSQVNKYISKMTGGDVDDKTIDNLSDEQIDKVSDYIMNLLSKGEDNTEEEKEEMKHNVFNEQNNDTIEHSQLMADILADAPKLGSLKESMLQHGITNIDDLLTVEVTSGAPEFIRPEEPSMVDSILASVKTTPKHTIRGRWADLTATEARARGYIKGKEKIEEFFDHWNRETHPQTIYKKQSLENDDIIDITDFDVVEWLRGEMREMWRYELARAIFIPDGREKTDPDKIKENRIRPITTDHKAFVTRVGGVTPQNFVEKVLKNKVSNYKGTGRPDMYMDEQMLVDLKLLKAPDGHYLYGANAPASTETLAAILGVGKIVCPEFLANTNQAIMVNLKDYELAAPNKGRSQTYEDFDIDYNKHKYLIEGRVAGALDRPKSAIVFSTATPDPELDSDDRKLDDKDE